MNDPASSAPVLVLGARITALGVIRTLGRAGIPNYISGGRDFTNWSRWRRRLPQELPGFPQHGRLAEWLDSTPLACAVLFPCDDDWAMQVATLPPRLRRRFPASSADAAALQCLVDKGRFAQVLEQYAIPHPHTVLINSVEELRALAGVDLSRTFIKPRDSLRFSRRYGVKALWVRDQQYAARVAADALTQGIPLMLQEYIPGPPTAHYFIDGFMDRNGAVLAQFARRRVRMHPADFGNSSFHISIPFEKVRPAAEDLNILLRSLRYRGIFSAEFKHDWRDGQFKILEVNARPWWYIEFAARAGVDVCSLAYADALGLPCEPVREYEVGRRCVTLELDLKAYLRMREQKQIGFWPWLHSWLGADRPVFSWSDPGPTLRVMLDIVRGRLASMRVRRNRPRPSAAYGPSGWDRVGALAPGPREQHEWEVYDTVPDRN